MKLRLTLNELNDDRGEEKMKTSKKQNRMISGLLMCLGLAFSFVCYTQGQTPEMPIRIDFDNHENQTMVNYVGFNPLLYDMERGYGWNEAVNAYRRWNYHFKLLTCDMHYSDQDRTFMVDLPNGEYTVKLYFRGSLSETYADNMQVFSEGILVLDHVNSTPYPNIRSFDANVSDGQLSLTFHDNGGDDNKWLVNGIEIYDRIPRPEITGVSNSQIIRGKSVTITGANFGIKRRAAPLKWDDFESGIDGVSVAELSDWAVWGEEGHKPAYKSGSVNRQGSSLCSENKMGPGDYRVRNSRLKWWTDENTDKLYVSFWTKFNFGRNIVDDNGSYQLKFWRLSETEVEKWNGSLCIGASNWKYDVGKPTEHPGHYYWVRTGGSEGFKGSDYYTPALEEDVWFRIGMQVKQSDVNTPNGGFSVWHSRSSEPIINVASNWDVVTREIPAKLRAISLGEWLGNLTDGETEVYYDDAYFDNSWARVEIGDSKSFDNCSHREIQIPSDWSDTSITITVNQGSFQRGDTVYLYVVDPDGNVNVNGYPVAFAKAQ